jgi:hypothetical protein
MRRVGFLARYRIPEASGIERDHRSAEPEAVQPRPTTEVCHYPEGDCQTVTRSVRCEIFVEYRCGAPGAGDEDLSLEPCDRPDRM